MDVVSTYIKVEKAGINYKARCPFHNEKTPSFFISTDRNTYYCFGCGEKGDIFTFVEKFEGLTFREALVKLADRAGVQLTNIPQTERTVDNVLFEIMDVAVEHYESRLKANKEVQAYLTKRGVTGQTLAEWRIGYAVNDWRDTLDSLTSKKYRETDIKRAGLIKYPDAGKGDRPYDTFRDRIMFPIFDLESRVVAFSGRIFGEDPNAPKYLNSPETEIFKKSETLYGLHKAKTEIRKKDFALLVEGQFDLVMMHQVGIKNTVATSGTAFTLEHAKRLKRYSNRILLAFDGDNAGIAAALRAGDIALKEGMEVKVVTFPKDEDPASLAVKDTEELKKILKDSMHLIDFRIELIKKQARDEREQNKLLKEQILPLIVLLESAMQQSHFIKIISQKLNIQEKSIIDDLKKIKNEHKEERVSHELKKSSTEEKVLGIIAWLDTKKDNQIDTKEFKDRLKNIVGEVSFVDDSDKEAAIFEAEQYYSGSSNVKKIIDELLNYLEEEILKRELQRLKREIMDAEKAKDKERITELITRSNEISSQMQKLKKNS